MDTASQEGGRLLGQGTYGCVFTPPLLCKNEAVVLGANKRKLGKLSQLEDVKNELQAARDLGKLPNVGSYFTLPDLRTFCANPKPMSKQKEPDIEKCGALERFGEKGMVHYKMNYGGQSLHVTIYSPTFKMNEFPYFRFVKHILEAGALLVLNGYVHFDLHGQNVLLSKDFTPRLIDFGRAFNILRTTQQTVDEHWTQYDASFAPEPPEITLSIADVEGIPFEQCLEDLRTEKDGILNLERVLGIPRSEQIREISKFWRTSRAAQERDWLGLWKTYWPVFDSWSIGSMCLSLLRKLLLTPEFADSAEWASKQTILEKVLRGMLQGSPRRRLDCVEALALFDPMNPIITRGAGRTWLQKKRR